MKSKLKIITLLALATMASTNVAQANCREKIKARFEPVPGAPISAIAGSTVTLAVAPEFFPVMLPILGVSFLWYLRANHADRFALKILKQAEAGHGPKIEKLYRTYLKGTTNPVSFSEFCQIIHEADTDGTFCKNDVKLRKFDIVQYVTENE